MLDQQLLLSGLAQHPDREHSTALMSKGHVKTFSKRGRSYISQLDTVVLTFYERHGVLDVQ